MEIFSYPTLADLAVLASAKCINAIQGTATIGGVPTLAGHASNVLILNHNCCREISWSIRSRFSYCILNTPPSGWVLPRGDSAGRYDRHAGCCRSCLLPRRAERKDEWEFVRKRADGWRLRGVCLLIALTMEPPHIMAFHILAGLPRFGFAEWAGDSKRSLIQHPSRQSTVRCKGPLIP